MLFSLYADTNCNQRQTCPGQSACPCQSNLTVLFFSTLPKASGHASGSHACMTHVFKWQAEDHGPLSIGHNLPILCKIYSSSVQSRYV